MAIEKSFYQEGIPYASGMTVGVGSPLDLRCVLEYPAQLAAIGRGNVYEGMPFFIKNVDNTDQPGFFILTGRPFDTKEEWEDFWRNLCISDYPYLHAQDSWNTYNTALQEIKNGKKETDWMWFIFPQMAISGKGFKSEYYGLGRIIDAGAYLSHPILGARLIECTEAFLSQPNPAYKVFGNELMHFRSCMILFNNQCDNKDNPFRRVLIREHWLF